MQQQDPSVKKRRRTKKQVSDKDEVKTPPKSIGNFRSLFLTKVNYCLSYIRKNDREGLSKVSNVLSLVVLSSACILWINYFFYLNSKEKAIAPNASSISVKGIFNYSGSPIYVSLIASGINIPLQDSNPEFRTRYAKPIVGDFSTDYAIAQLINGELSFVYTDRPLNDGEYGRANLRSISLEQVAVGIDGIVVFGNNDLNVGQLNLDQVRRIYAGEITNWHQIDPKIENLPITPIAVKNEKIEGIETTSSNIEYTENNTLAVRKLIKTPGTICFASASLVQNQQLIKVLALADATSTNYIYPKLDGKLNLKAFEDGSYPLTRRIYLIYRKDGSRDQKAGKFYADYLKLSDIQEIIEKSGFVSIY
jgi:phosphate transport system substrate-binding protein